MRSHNQLSDYGTTHYPQKFQWLHSLKVEHKIAIGYAIVLGITIFGTITGIVISNFYIQEAKKKIEHTSEEIDFPKELERHIFFATYYQQELAIGSESPELSQKKLKLFKHHIREFRKSTSQFKAHYQEESGMEESAHKTDAFNYIIEQHEQEIVLYLNQIEKLAQSLEESFLEPAKLRKTQELLREFQDSPISADVEMLLVELDEFIEIVSQDNKTSIEILDKAIKFQFRIIFISFGLSILAACSLAFIMGRTISHPLQTLKFSVDKSSEIIFWFDARGKLIYTNETASAYLGYEFQELLNMKLADFDLTLPKDSWSEFWQELKSQGLIKFESSIKRSQCSDCSIEININYLEVKGIAYGFAFARDISERKQTEQMLLLAKQSSESANKAKSEFLANMSHELRTPLNAVLGFTRLMNRDSNLTPKQLKNLQTINRSGEHLLSLINDVLNLSKIESGQMTLNLISFDFHRLLNSIGEIFKLKANNKGIELLVYYAPEVPQYIKTDEQKVRQVLMNLLSNAIKFTKKGKVILRVTAIDHPDGSTNIQCAVEDTGDGIAPEELDLVFKPFVQTTTGRNNNQGTGLGLPISHKFIQLMGGEIEVNSVINQGTMVQFNLIAELGNIEEFKDETNKRKVIGLESEQPDYRILVVDDYWENRQILVQLLESVGFKVAEAKDGQEANLIWSTWKPHLIWMDMRMPILDGYQATQQIKSHLQGQSTAIIALTASAFEEEKSIILAAGCDDYVSKPFKESIIWDKMTQHLGVRFIYEESKLFPNIKVNHSFKLEPSALQIMSLDWISQLEKATLELEEESIAELLEQIPDEHALLAQSLQDKLDDFDFGKLLDLAQQAHLT